MQKRHKINYSGLFIFIVLFLFFSFSFYEILLKSPAKVSHYQLASVSSNALVLNKFQQPSINKSWLPQFDNSNFKVITKHIKLFTNNRLILKRISVFQKIELKIVFLKPPGFYYHYNLRASDDLPVLS